MTKGRLLRDVGELGFLRRLLPTLRGGRGVLVGAGDDCAVVRGFPRLVVTTDVLVEGVHFERDWQSPQQLGAKSILVNLSDIAAMGGRSRYCLLSVGVPGSHPLKDLELLHRGAQRAAQKASASIVGGNVSAAPSLFISVTVLGMSPRRPLLRSGARVGDLVFVTGTLGDAAAGVRLLQAGLRDGPGRAALIRRYVAPTPRLDVGLRLATAGVPSAMIDVSDGLVQDLGHICESSGVGAIVSEARVPRSRAYRAVIGGDPALALSGGEDYELMFTVPPRRLARLEGLRPRLSCPLTCIGEVVARPKGVRIQDKSGRLYVLGAGGYEHFHAG